MDTAWAGGGPKQHALPQSVAPSPHGDLWHRLAHQIGDVVGWQTFLIAGAIGLAVIFKKRLRKWLE